MGGHLIAPPTKGPKVKPPEMPPTPLPTPIPQPTPIPTPEIPPLRRSGTRGQSAKTLCPPASELKIFRSRCVVLTSKGLARRDSLSRRLCALAWDVENLAT